MLSSRSIFPDALPQLRLPEKRVQQFLAAEFQRRRQKRCPVAHKQEQGRDPHFRWSRSGEKPLLLDVSGYSKVPYEGKVTFMLQMAPPYFSVLSYLPVVV
jgi:hypothetical protein